MNSQPSRQQVSACTKVYGVFTRDPQCVKSFGFDLADVYKVLRPTTARPRKAAHHTSANEHDVSRHANLTMCVKNRWPAFKLAIQLSMRVCNHNPWSVKVGQVANTTSASTSLSLLQSVWSFHPRPAMCIEFWLDLVNVYEVFRPTTALPR